MASRRKKSQENIKETLSMSADQSPSFQMQPMSQTGAGNTRGRDLEELTPMGANPSETQPKSISRMQTPLEQVHVLG